MQWLGGQTVDRLVWTSTSQITIKAHHNSYKLKHHSPLDGLWKGIRCAVALAAEICDA